MECHFCFLVSRELFGGGQIRRTDKRILSELKNLTFKKYGNERYNNDGVYNRYDNRNNIPINDFGINRNIYLWYL